MSPSPFILIIGMMEWWNNDLWINVSAYMYTSLVTRIFSRRAGLSANTAKALRNLFKLSQKYLQSVTQSCITWTTTPFVEAVITSRKVLNLKPHLPTISQNTLHYIWRPWISKNCPWNLVCVMAEIINLIWSQPVGNTRVIWVARLQVEWLYSRWERIINKRNALLKW